MVCCLFTVEGESFFYDARTFTGPLAEDYVASLEVLDALVYDGPPRMQSWV